MVQTTHSEIVILNYVPLYSIVFILIKNAEEASKIEYHCVNNEQSAK